jgi:hypothetical protein
MFSSPLPSSAGICLALLVATLGLQGCASIEPVEAWQKGMLAKPEMTFDDDLLDKGFREHIYSSKESSSGGAGVGGGGCGCN